MNLRSLGRHAFNLAETTLLKYTEPSPEPDDREAALRLAQEELDSLGSLPTLPPLDDNVDVSHFSTTDKQVAKEILESDDSPEEQLAQMRFLAKRSATTPKQETVTPKPSEGILESTTRDLSAQSQPSHQFVGREDVLQQLETAFASTINNSAVLEGEVGVGTSAIVAELARRSNVENDPLHGKRFLQMNMGSLMAGTSLRGQFEEKITNLIAEIKNSGDDIVLVVENIEQAIGAGSSTKSNSDAAGFLAPEIISGNIQVLGITTPEHADRLHESELGRALTRVSVSEMSREDSVKVLDSMRDFFEQESGVVVDPSILPHLVEKADKTAPHKFLPGKAVELLDQAVARARVGKSDSLTNEHLTRALESRQQGSEVLAKFGRNISELAENGELGPFVGREKESRLMARTLLRPGKNSPVLIGEGGVGKTAVVEKLAVDMLKPDHPLHGKSIIEVSALALAEDPDKVEKLLKVSQRDPNLVVFIDEVHMVMTDTRLANSLKPALANGELSVVGATTLQEYNQWVLPDGAMNRRFKQVYVPEPTVEETAEILQVVSTHFEKKQGVDLPDEFIPRIVDLTHGTIPNRFQPDIGIDVLRDVIAETQFDGEQKVEMKTVEAMVLEAVEASEALMQSA